MTDADPDVGALVDLFVERAGDPERAEQRLQAIVDESHGPRRDRALAALGWLRREFEEVRGS